MAETAIKPTLHGQQAYEALVRAKDPDAALLYVYAASCGGASEDEAARALGFSADKVKRAASLLCLYGLTDSAPPREPEPAAPGEIAEARRADTLFGNLCGYLEGALGRILRRAELETLYNIYGNLGLPAEVLVLMINFCKETHRLSARELERQAYSWHDRGIDSYERAERYLDAQRQLYSRSWAIRKLLGIHERKPSDNESKYISDWAEKGVSDELLRLAYGRTTERTGKLSWAYMDKILQNWREKGIKTAKQAEELDGARPKPAETTEKADSIEATVRRRFDSRRKRREEQMKERVEALAAQSAEFVELEKRRRLCASALARAPESRRAPLEAEFSELGAARRELLAKLGKPADWLDDRPDCEKCGDRGYIGAVMCECFKLECDKERSKGAAVND